MKKNNLLIELLTEELPPRALLRMIQGFQRQLALALQTAELSFDSIQMFVTPRRLALKVNALVAAQVDTVKEKRGPTVALAYTESGELSAAGKGFLKSVAATENDVFEKEGYIYVKQKILGNSLESLLPRLLTQSIEKIPVPKHMRWGNHTETFSRPVHGVVLLYGSRVIPAVILGIKTSNQTLGHRFHHPQLLTLKHADDYEAALFQAKVIVDFEKRRKEITTQLYTLAEKAKTSPKPNSALLDEVTGLVEWPVAVLAQFSPDFLHVPAESLISAMEHHQKSFALLDQTGKLLPAFIAISNISSLEPDRVRIGNEKVMRARLSDAAYFYESDLKISPTARIPALKETIFHAKLGTLYDKSLRIAKILKVLAVPYDLSQETIEQVSILAKTDLLTEMVEEFPELQGIMGYYYARAHQISNDIALAIKEQYQPRTAQDEMPKTTLGALLGIADKIDTLIGLFGVNLLPTGEKDPFALRRAALGILRVCIALELSIDLPSLLRAAFAAYDGKLSNQLAVKQVEDFIWERLRYLLMEEKTRPDIFSAVLAIRPPSPLAFVKRVNALTQCLLQASAEDLLIMVFRRVARFLEKEMDLSAEPTVSLLGDLTLERIAESENAYLNIQLLQEPAEKALAEAITPAAKQCQVFLQEQAFGEILDLLIELSPLLQNFFEHVFIADPDPAIKNNRLQLLGAIYLLFIQLADFSVLQSPETIVH